jgi:hypothetical protein
MPVTTRQYVLLFLVVLACACPVTCCGSARAGEPGVVDGDQVCRVQHAVRWRNSAWPDAKCERIAAALNATRDPRLTEAVCVNESDFREDVVSLVRPGVYDAGLCGVRCVLYPGRGATARGDGPRSAGRPAGLPAGRCSNGPARGYTLRQLLDGPTNILLADQILHGTHGGSLRRYNGGTREHGYAGRVGAILAALGGVDAFAKRRHEASCRRETRAEKLTRQILEALAEEKRS